MVLLLRGGASIPCSAGWLSASAPLVQLEASPTGIVLSVRSRFVRKFFGVSAPWTVRWDEIDRVFIARRSVVIVPRHGRNCRFGTLTAGPIRPLLLVLSEHGVKTVPTRTTFGGPASQTSPVATSQLPQEVLRRCETSANQSEQSTRLDDPKGPAKGPKYTKVASYGLS